MYLLCQFGRQVFICKVTMSKGGILCSRYMKDMIYFNPVIYKDNDDRPDNAFCECAYLRWVRECMREFWAYLREFRA